MQIVNGGQTCKTIHETLKSTPGTFGQSAYVLVRIYQFSKEDENFLQDIIYATNNPNPLDSRDTYSNDELQKVLELGMKDLGYTYNDNGKKVVVIPQLLRVRLPQKQRSQFGAKSRIKRNFVEKIISVVCMTIFLEI